MYIEKAAETTFVRKMLMKLTTGLNFTKILWAVFAQVDLYFESMVYTEHFFQHVWVHGTLNKPNMISRHPNLPLNDNLGQPKE